MPKQVVIFGANSAVAQACARLLAERGDRVFLVARNRDKLERFSAQLGDSLLGSVVADLDELDANEAVVGSVFDRVDAVDAVLIAHGYLGDQLRSEDDWQEAHAQLRTNYLSPVSLLIPLANELARRGRGHIGVITSVAGERGRPRNFTYGSAKGGLSRYLEGLRSRLRGTGVFVHNFKLGPVDSPMTVDHQKSSMFTTPQRAARSILAGFGTRRHVIYVPAYWRIIMAVVRPMPELIFSRLKFLSGR